ncbi:MAG TPA: BTAD domain-containing putative transcriptional regulator, partial [Acidimicrobiales bacterium]|nr:BTAD domain-containing putative transcriptional regulator [Acidimicrobiales bacterium]
MPAGRSGIQIHTLGTFAVTAGGKPVAVPNGLPKQALKLTIIHGGQIHVEVVMEQLWPGIDLAGGRKGIRNILSRMSRVGLPLLVRDGDVLRLGDGVWVDAHLFQMLADRAVTAADQTAATRTARRALALYNGALLPDDRYVDWTAVPRRRLRRRRLAMLDMLAADSRVRGAYSEAVHLMELALE